MASEKTARFQISTIMPELINQRIQRIETRLTEISFVYESGNCLARGLVERRVCFREPVTAPRARHIPLADNSRLRSHLDHFQFAVIIEEPLPADLSQPEAELIPEYYTFHPGGAAQAAMLLQGFLLRFPEISSLEPDPAEFEEIQVQRVVEQARGITILKVSFQLPSGGKPKSFRGSVTNTVPDANPLILMLTGTIVYLRDDGILAETRIEEEVTSGDFACKKPFQGEEVNHFRFKLSDYHFRRGPKATEWLLELKTDYEWLHLQTETINCPIADNLSDEPNVTALLPVTVANYERQFLRVFFIDMPDMALMEIQCLMRHYQAQRVSDGVLLTLELHIECCGVDSHQCETVRTITIQTEELLTDIPESRVADLQLFCKLSCRISNFALTPPSIRLPVTFDCQIKFVQETGHIFEICETQGQWIFAKLLDGEKDFHWMGEEELPLENECSEIRKVASSLLKGTITRRGDWLDYETKILLTVDYSSQNRPCTKIFTIPVMETGFWEGLPKRATIDYHSAIETDGIRNIDGKFLYGFILRLSCTAWDERPVRIRAKILDQNGTVIGRQFHGKRESSAPPPSPEQVFEMTFQKILYFPNGISGEFVENKLSVTVFNSCRLNARWFVSGILEWIGAYWDSKGFYHEETREIPFWHFHHEWPWQEMRNVKPTIKIFKIGPVANRGFVIGSRGKGQFSSKGKLVVSLTLMLDEV